MIAGTDVPAVDGLQGAGDDKAFNIYASQSGNREINASSNKDLMHQISAIIKRANTTQPIKWSDGNQAAANQRFAEFKAAYRDPDQKPMRVLGEVMSDEIWETLGREGFSNKFFAIQNIDKGATGRVKVRKKDVVAFQMTSDVKVQEQRIRQTYVYPPEFYIQCYILIEDKEIEQSSSDLLDEKFQDGLEAMLVREDRITKALWDASISSFNDPIFYTSFNPTVFSTLRSSVGHWGVQPANMVFAWDIWDDIIADPDFVAWFDPVTKHELVLEGHLGQMLGVALHTDGLRYPTLQVLNPGDIYMLGAPISMGSKVIRKPLDSRAIDTYNIGRAARGWFLHQIQGQIVVNGRATAGGKRL